MQMLVDFERKTITVNGIEISTMCLAVITDPDPAALYRFERDENCVSVTRVTDEQKPAA